MCGSIIRRWLLVMSCRIQLGVIGAGGNSVRVSFIWCRVKVVRCIESSIESVSSCIELSIELSGCPPRVSLGVLWRKDTAAGITYVN